MQAPRSDVAPRLAQIYAEYSRVANMVTEARGKQARLAFAHFDRDASGSIDASEFRELARFVAPALSDEEALAAFGSIDRDCSGSLTQDEFVAWWCEHNAADDASTKLKRSLNNWGSSETIVVGGEALAELASAPAIKPAPPGSSDSSPSRGHRRTGSAGANIVVPDAPTLSEHYVFNPQAPSLYWFFPVFEGFHSAPYALFEVTAMPVEMLLRFFLAPGANHLDPLTSPAGNMLSTFLLTYSDYLGALDLLRLLAERMHCRPDPVLVPAAQAASFDLGRVQSVVLAFLGAWLSQHPYDFLPEPVQRAAVALLRDARDCPTLASSATALKLIADTETLLVSCAARCHPEYASVDALRTCYPPPILPKSLALRSIMDIDALELARQITLITFETFTRIAPNQFLSKRAECDSVNALGRLYNRLANLCCTEILARETAPERTTVMCYVIDVSLLLLKPFDCFLGSNALYVALLSAPIDRLRPPNEAIKDEFLPVEYRERMQMLRDKHAIDVSASKSFKRAHRDAPAPGVPVYSLYDRTLLTIDATEPKRVGEHRMLNMARQRFFEAEIREMMHLREGAYLIQRVPVVARYIEKDALVHDDAKLYALSLERQPRGAKPPKTQPPKLTARSITGLAKPFVNAATPPKPLAPPPPRVAALPAPPSSSLAIDALELARQLTLLVAPLYLAIDQGDFVAAEPVAEPGAAATMPTAAAVPAAAAAASLSAVRAFEARLACVCVHDVLQGEDAPGRAARLCHWLEVARALLVLGNFSGVMAVASALTTGAVAALPHTLALLPEAFAARAKPIHCFADVHALAAYRHAYRLSAAPAIPHLDSHVRLMHLSFKALTARAGDGGATPAPGAAADSATDAVRFYRNFAASQRAAHVFAPVPAVQAFVTGYALRFGPSPDLWLRAARHIEGHHGAGAESLSGRARSGSTTGGALSFFGGSSAPAAVYEFPEPEASVRDADDIFADIQRASLQG